MICLRFALQNFLKMWFCIIVELFDASRCMRQVFQDSAFFSRKKLLLIYQQILVHSHLLQTWLSSFTSFSSMTIFFTSSYRYNYACNIKVHIALWLWCKSVFSRYLCSASFQSYWGWQQCTNYFQKSGIEFFFQKSFYYYARPIELTDWYCDAGADSL